MRAWGSIAGRSEQCARVRSCSRRRGASGIAPEPETRWSKDPVEQHRAAAWDPGTGRNHGAGCVRARSPRPRTQAYSPAIGRRPVLAEEFVEGLAGQGLDCPALGGAEHAQLAVDGLGNVAGDLDASGTAVPGGPAGSGRLGVFARPRASDGYWYFCIRHSDLPGGRTDTHAERVLRRRDPPCALPRAATGLNTTA